MTDAPPVVSIRDVAKSFGSGRDEVRVLRGVSLDVECGCITAIAGPSGSGKTTLLHLAALLDAPDSGEIRFEGRPVGPGDAARLRRMSIGMVFQRFHLLPHRTALDNVAFRFRYTEVGPREALDRAGEMLREVGLSHAAHTRARLLSGGEMQRVALARALVLAPKALLADEPTGNLDDASAEQVMRLLLECRGRGVAVLLATHNPRWLDLCDRRLDLEAGRLKEDRKAAL